LKRTGIIIAFFGQKVKCVLAEVGILITGRKLPVESFFGVVL
jgi:hypothetical protein